jgi:hypothetical protein
MPSTSAAPPTISRPPERDGETARWLAGRSCAPAKEETMAERTGPVAGVQILLTITALEFFGPILRDFGPSHAWNPSWVGHARVHLVWLLGYMFLSGLVNLHLIWLRHPRVPNLRLSALWQCCNLGGFWIAYVLVPVYGGLITVPGEHVHILGFDENVFVFMVLSGVMLVALGLLRFGVGGEESHAPR